jgi:hypothetical protein
VSGVLGERHIEPSLDIGFLYKSGVNDAVAPFVSSR